MLQLTAIACKPAAGGSKAQWLCSNARHAFFALLRLQRCPAGLYCPAGASEPRSCPPFSICRAQSAQPAEAATLLLVASLFLWLSVRRFVRRRQRQRAAHIAARSAFFARRFAPQLRRWSAAARQRLWLRKGCAGAGPLHHRGGSYDVNVMVGAKTHRDGAAPAPPASATVSSPASSGIGATSLRLAPPKGTACKLSKDGHHSQGSDSDGRAAAGAPCCDPAVDSVIEQADVKAHNHDVAVDASKVSITLQASGRAVIAGATLRLAAGKLHAILGPSGTGKSILLQHLAGRADPAVSQITGGGIRINTGSRAEALAAANHCDSSIAAETVTEAQPVGAAVRRSTTGSCSRRGRQQPLAVQPHIAYLPQTDVLPEGLTVREAVRCALRLRHATRTRAYRPCCAFPLTAAGGSSSDTEAVEVTAAALERLLDLHSVSGSIVQTPQQQTEGADAASGAQGADEAGIEPAVAGGGDVSGGQRKRVALAVELARDAQIYILDEPTSSLDAASAARLISALQRFCDARGATVVMSVHQPRAGIFSAFHSVTLLSEGGVAYHGPPAAALPYFRFLGFGRGGGSDSGSGSDSDSWIEAAQDAVASHAAARRTAPSPIAAGSVLGDSTWRSSLTKASPGSTSTDAAPDFLLDVLSGFVPRPGFPAFHPSDLAVEWAALVDLGAVPWVQWRTQGSVRLGQPRPSDRSAFAPVNGDEVTSAMATGPVATVAASGSRGRPLVEPDSSQPRQLLHRQLSDVSASDVMATSRRDAAAVASAYVHFRRRTSVQLHAQMLQRAVAASPAQIGRLALGPAEAPPAGTPADISLAATGSATTAKLEHSLHDQDGAGHRDGVDKASGGGTASAREAAPRRAASMLLANAPPPIAESPAWERTMLVHPSSATHTGSHSAVLVEVSCSAAAPGMSTGSYGGPQGMPLQLPLPEVTVVPSRMTVTTAAVGGAAATNAATLTSSTEATGTGSQKEGTTADAEMVSSLDRYREPEQHAAASSSFCADALASVRLLMLTSEWQAAACAVAALAVTAALAAFVEADDSVRANSNLPVVLITPMARSAAMRLSSLYATAAAVDSNSEESGSIVFTRTSVLASELTSAHVAAVVHQRQIALAAIAALLAFDAAVLAGFSGGFKSCRARRGQQHSASPRRRKLRCPTSSALWHTVPPLISVVLALIVLSLVAAAVPPQGALAVALALMVSRVCTAAAAADVSRNNERSSLARASEVGSRAHCSARSACSSRKRSQGCPGLCASKRALPDELETPPSDRIASPATDTRSSASSQPQPLAGDGARGADGGSSTAINVADSSAAGAVASKPPAAADLPMHHTSEHLTSAAAATGGAVTRRKISREAFLAGLRAEEASVAGASTAIVGLSDGARCRDLFSTIATPQATQSTTAAGEGSCALPCGASHRVAGGLCCRSTAAAGSPSEAGTQQAQRTSAQSGCCVRTSQAASTRRLQFDALLRRALTQAWRSGRWGGGPLLLLFCLGCLVGILFDDSSAGDLSSLPLRLLLSTLVVALAAAATPLPVLQRSRGLFFHEVAAGVSPTAWLAAVDVSLFPLLLLQPAAFLLGSSLFAAPSGSDGTLLTILIGVHWAATGLGALAAAAAPHGAASAVVGAVMVSALLSGFNPSLAFYSEKLGLSPALRDVLLAPSFCRWASEALFVTEAQGEVTPTGVGSPDSSNATSSIALQLGYPLMSPPTLRFSSADVGILLSNRDLQA